MRVESDKLGALEVDEDTVLTFPQGLLGFDDKRRFVLVETNETGLYYWLQSIEDPALAFLAAVPWPFFPSYEFELPDADRDALGLEEPEPGADPSEIPTMVLCLLTVDPGPDGTGPHEITANLLGPLVINTQSRVGRQVVLVDGDFTTRAPLAAAS